MDLDHEDWGWFCAEEKVLRNARERLGQYEGKTWKEILAMRGGRGPYNGLVEIHEIARRNRDAAVRLSELPGLASASTMMKLRAGGELRMWGVMDENICYLVWIDPNHTVWGDS